MPEEVFDGFDHTQYKDEVIERWGREAYESGDRWWRSMSDDDKRAFQQTQLDIARDFGEARRAGLAPDSDEVQAITQRQYEWIGVGWQDRPVTAGGIRRPGPDVCRRSHVHARTTTCTVRGRPSSSATPCGSSPTRGWSSCVVVGTPHAATGQGWISSHEPLRSKVKSWGAADVQIEDQSDVRSNVGPADPRHRETNRHGRHEFPDAR